jgi:hypothetical protein
VAAIEGLKELNIGGGAASSSQPERPLDPTKAKYDSKKSFFDEISTGMHGYDDHDMTPLLCFMFTCDSGVIIMGGWIDRDNRSGPPDMGAQRKTDAETFGDSARHYRPRNYGGGDAGSRHGHAHGGGHHGGGAGGSRGGRGGGGGGRHAAGGNNGAPRRGM